MKETAMLITWLRITFVSYKPFQGTYIIGQHQSSGLNGKLSGFLILDNGSSKTGSRGSLSRGINCSWQESANVSVEYSKCR